MSAPLNIPVGFSADALPLYLNLDDVRFEEFCAAFLNLRPKLICSREDRPVERRILNANRLLSGGDDGVDIRADAEQGEVWFFQCKNVKEFVPSQVKAVIQKAQLGYPQSDQFALLTACGISEESKNVLREAGWRWWGPSELTTEILKLRPREDAINFVHRFFPDGWAKKLFLNNGDFLLKWQEFFAADLSENRKYFHHRTPLIGSNSALERLDDFANSNNGRALILSAAGGCGKSRLLLEFARRSENHDQSARTRFLNLNRCGLNADQLDFLSRESESLVLVMDDAHRVGPALDSVIRTCSERRSISLVIATRPHAVEALQSRLFECGYAEKLEPPLKLDKPTGENLLALAEAVLHPAYRMHALQLASLSDGCPLLVTMGGTLINAGIGIASVRDQELFKQRVFNGFKEDILNQQPQVKRERLDRLIRFLSFVSPAQKNDALVEKAAAVLNCSMLDVVDDLSTLEGAEIVIQNREGLRLYPDLFADAMLLESCLDKSKGSFFYREVMKHLSAKDFPSLMRNLAQADWEARAMRRANDSLFEPIWQQFVSWFKEGEWPREWTDFRTLVLEKYGNGASEVRRQDRGELLSQWASFAVYLPERTLTLAELALNLAKESPEAGRRCVSSALPALLKPIVIWHYNLAKAALDLLWGLDAEEPQGNWSNISGNAIAAIADAASFSLEKPLRSSEIVLQWLRERLLDPATLQRLTKESWIISCVLKPLFDREIEYNWSSGRSVHMCSSPVSVERTRSLREGGLQIVRHLLNNGQPGIFRSLLAVLQEAIQPVYHRFGGSPPARVHEDWRPDRINALQLIEEAVRLHRDSPVILFKLRRIVWTRCDHDPDEVFQTECWRVLKAIPDGFELRVVRAVASWSHDEVKIRSGAHFETDLTAAEAEWSEFQRSVARELAERYPAAEELCRYLAGVFKELRSEGVDWLSGTVLHEVASLTPQWCAALLGALLDKTENTLDRSLVHILGPARQVSPAAYSRALEYLPNRGRAEQVCALVSFLGSMHIHGGGLSEKERAALRQSALRSEESVVTSLASVASIHLQNDPRLAISLLASLHPSTEGAGKQTLHAICKLLKSHSGEWTETDIKGCLVNLGEFAIPDNIRDRRDLRNIGHSFPRIFYEHVRDLCATANESSDVHWRLADISLGPINDDDFVQCEIEANITKALAAEEFSAARNHFLGLARALVWADPRKAPPRIEQLLRSAESKDRLKIVVDLVAVQGSNFVFSFPLLTKTALARATQLGMLDTILEEFQTSACGGGRSYTENELDPEYRHILESASDLASRHQSDPFLHRLYHSIAEYERRSNEWHTRMFAEENET